MFGNYSIIRTLGVGEFGKVKLAVHYKTFDKVAIKLVKKDALDSSKKLKVLREIQMLQSISHPFVISIKNVIENSQYMGIVMEYASGGELFHYIMAQPDGYLTCSESKTFFAQLIAGVSYIHSLGIVHRDLKLENLLLSKSHSILISDFGFANKSSDFMVTSCGSPGYAAPELVLTDGYVGESADIWSCGVILYGMMCGYLPYDDDPANPDSEDINMLYKYILGSTLSYPSYINNEAKLLISSILVPNPTKRAKMMDIMMHCWLRDRTYMFQAELDRRLVLNFNIQDLLQTEGKSVMSGVNEILQSTRSTNHRTRHEIDPRIPPHERKSAFDNELVSKIENQVIIEDVSSRVIDIPRKPQNCSVDVGPAQSIKSAPVISNSPLVRAPSIRIAMDRVCSDYPDSRMSISNSVSGSDFDYGDKGLRKHTGPIDPRALSSKTPAELCTDLIEYFQNMQWEVSVTERKYKLVVRKPHAPVAKEVGQRMPKQLNGFPLYFVSKLRNLFILNDRGFDGKSRHLEGRVEDIVEEVLFTIEVQKVEGMAGAVLVDFRRIRGDGWLFKKLYGGIIKTLPL